MKNKIWAVLICLGLIILICTFLNKDYYYRLFNKSGEIYQRNSRGNFEGNSKIYKKGIKTFEGNFIDGKLEGFVYDYYDSGIIKSKAYYKKGDIDGSEYQFYPIGKISFIGVKRNGVPYGGQLYYSRNGKLDEYWARDFRDMPNDFFYIFYKNDGTIRKILGTIISENLAISEKGRFEIIKENTSYKNLRNIYFTMACPPGLKSSIKIKINNILYEVKKVKSNTVIIANAFRNQGKYNIEAYGVLKTNDGKVIKRDTITVVINKD